MYTPLPPLPLEHVNLLEEILGEDAKCEKVNRMKRHVAAWSASSDLKVLYRVILDITAISNRHLIRRSRGVQIKSDH